MNTASEKQVRLLIDMNSIVNQAMLGGTDHENGIVLTHPETGKDVKINSALYTVDRFLERYKQALEHFDIAPVDVVAVWDGKGGKAYRQMFLPQYKAGRDKLPEQHEVLNEAKESINTLLRFLGTTVVQQDACEADDTLAYLAKHLTSTSNIIYTGDGDLTVLVGGDTHVWRQGELDKNPYGPFPFKHVLTYKSLVGDTSDKIPGAKGFGDAAFVKLVQTYGLDGLDQMLAEIEGGTLKTLSENVSELKELQKIIDSEEQVTNSWRAAKLYPERVNVNRRPMTVLPGFCNPNINLPADLLTYKDMFARYWPAVKLVSSENYLSSLAHFRKHAGDRFELAFDIETSTGEESDDWLAAKGKDNGVDVIGSKLTGFSLTYGFNLQYTVYVTVDHVEEQGVTNITLDQARVMLEAIPAGTEVVIHNVAFEFPVMYKEFGEAWKDNGWHGFIPNALDTSIEASYVNENQPRGLKNRSKTVLDYEQENYERVSTKEGPVSTISGGTLVEQFDKVIVPAVTKEVVKMYRGEERIVHEIVVPAVTEKWERRKYKMNQLTARHVLGYGADDTICTAALHTYFRFVMECEDTWGVYRQVEQLPAYLTALAFVQGLRWSPARLRELEAEDSAAYDEAWKGFEQFLLNNGWEGTVKPVYDEVTPAAAKEVYNFITGEEFTTRKRKLEGVAADMRDVAGDDGRVEALADVVEAGDVRALNKLVDVYFDGKPKFNANSTRQKQKLFYEVIGMTPRLFNKLTDKQRDDEAMREAFRALRKYKEDPGSVDVTAEMRELWLTKASTDDDAIALAMHMDDLKPECRAALEAYSTLRTIMTRQSLFYTPYKTAAHWTDGRLHPNLIQCQAATRRYSASDPNVQQLPKSSGGIRGVFLPHCKDGLVVSLDFSSQELRILAHLSQDKNMLACYLGDDLKDIHSMVGAQASEYLWEEPVTYEELRGMLADPGHAQHNDAKALRKHAKSTVFGTSYGMQAPKLAVSLMTDEETAQNFIDAKEAAFPDVPVWKDRCEAEASKLGYSTTLMGARRHLGQALRSDDQWEVSRAERQASNAAIQASAAEQTKLAMARLWDCGVFTSGKYDAVFMMPIHDEVVASVHKDHAVEVIKIIHECMTAQYANMSVPAVSSISVGLNFGDQIEVGDCFDAEAIAKAVGELFEVKA